MPFKVKDLLIELASTTAVAQCHPTFICYHSGCHNFCSYLASVCQAGCSLHLPSICTTASVTATFTCPGSLVTDTSPIFQTIPHLGGPALGNLKSQLKQALELAERQEVAEAESLKVQTVADAELVEKKLTEALEEIRVRKAELQKHK
ncbi:MAG: hypothetical protein JWN34_870 [Bryobacterales bacterium]|nr:hypothetical protein [Bryobacterales bacterium]